MKLSESIQKTNRRSNKRKPVPVQPTSYPVFSITGPSPSSISEGNSGSTVFTFVVTRTGGLNYAATVGWTVSGYSANPADASDFTGPVTGTLNFAANQTVATINVAVVGDTLAEANENFQVIISNPSIGTISNSVATATILDDDTSSVPFELGLNIESQYYGNPNAVGNDILPMGSWWSWWNGTAYQTVPGANLNPDGWPISTTGLTNFQYFRAALSAIKTAPANYTVTWQGNLTLTQSGANYITINSQDDGTKTASVTITADMVNVPGAVIGFHYIPGATFPTNIKVMPQGVSTLIDSKFQADTTAVTSSHGPLRIMHMTDVENNAGVDPDSGPIVPFPTVTIRTSTINGGNQLLSAGDSSVNLNPNDGVSIEFAVAMCNALNRDFWDNYELNYTNAQIDARATYVRDHLNPSLKYFVESSNETWNSGYRSIWNQLGAEAASLGITDSFSGTGARVQRAAEIACTQYDRILAIWNASSGSKPTLKRVFAIQNGTDDPSGLATGILNYSSARTNNQAVYTHIDVLSSAPYFDHNGVVDVNYTGDKQVVFDGCYLSIDKVIGIQAKAIKDAAATKGLTYAAYEGGQSMYFWTDTYVDSVQSDSRMYDVYMYYFDRISKWLPGCTFTNFTNSGGYWYHQAQGGNGEGFGIKKNTTQIISKANTPKAQACVDFIAGKRKLQPLYGTFSTVAVGAGAPVNTPLGYLKRRLNGSVISLQSNPSGAVAITDITADTLQFTVANAAPFASAGTVTIVVRETDSRDIDGVGFRDTTVVIPVNSLGTMNLNFITPSYTVNGTSYGSTLASIPGYSYSRPSSLQVMNSGGAVSTFNANVVPINALGLHSYIGLSNVCGDPQAFDAWQIAGATITPNTTVAPDGSTTADTVNVTASCFVLHSANVNNNQPYTFSWFAKRGTATDFSYRVRDWFAATDTVPVTSYYSQTNSSTFSRIIVPFTSTGTANAYVENNAATGTFFLWQAQIIPGNFPDGGPLVTSNTDTPSLSFTMPNGVYSVTYTFDDNTTQTISQTVSGNVFTVATAPTLNRGRIKSIVA